MIGATELVARVQRLTMTDLERWVAADLVRPGVDETAWTFEDADVARVTLICDMHHTLAVAEDDLPLVLSLVDQLYDTRCRLRTLLEAVNEQPEDVRTALLRRLGESDPAGP